MSNCNLMASRPSVVVFCLSFLSPPPPPFQFPISLPPCSFLSALPLFMQPGLSPLCSFPPLSALPLFMQPGLSPSAHFPLFQLSLSLCNQASPPLLISPFFSSPPLYATRPLPPLLNLPSLYSMQPGYSGQIPN